MDFEEARKAKLRYEMMTKNEGNGLAFVKKEEWIKTSFWAPDNTPDAGPQNAIKPPSKKLACPAVANTDEAHSIKVKELVTLKLQSETNKNGDKSFYSCWVCTKQLGHQKIACLKGCGHVMCKQCILEFCLKDNSKCFVCEKKIENGKKDMIDLIESGSAFASHSKVEATIFKPSF